jgi:transposase
MLSTAQSFNLETVIEMSDQQQEPIVTIREKIAAAKAKAKPEKRPVGRPTKYCPEFCELAIEMGKLGYSPAMIACEFEIDKASMYHWGDEHAEFLTALRAAKTYEQGWWEREGMGGLRSRDFNANLWVKSAQARFREDYTERKETAVTGADGGAIKVEQTQKIDARQLDPEARAALKKILLAEEEQ